MTACILKERCGNAITHDAVIEEVNFTPPEDI